MPSEVFVIGVVITGLVLIVAHLVRLWRTAIFHKTLREAIIRNVDSLGPLLADGIEPPPPAANDTRNALVLLAIGLAMVAFGLIQGDADDIRNLASAAVFPVFVAVALFVRDRWFPPRV